MIQTTQREKLGTLLALVFKLQDETSFTDSQKRQEALNQLTIYAQQIGLNLDPNDPEFLPTLLIRILEENAKPTELPPGNLPPQELMEIYEKDKQEKEAQLQKAMASKQNYRDYNNYIDLFKKWILKNKPQLPNQLASAIAEKSAQKAIASFEPIAQPNVLNEADEIKIFEQVEKIIQEELKKIEFEKQAVVQEAEKIVQEEFKKAIEEQSVKIAATPKIIGPIQEAAKVTVIPRREIPIPDSILEKLQQPSEEVSFLPIYTIAHPKVFAAWIEKKFYTLPAKLLKIGAEEATPEWQAMVNQGVFTEDYQASIKTLKDWGLSVNHPIIKKLEDKAQRSKEQQKVSHEIKKGTSLIQTWKDTTAARILKHYYHFNKITGRQKIYDPDLKANLPKLEADLSWSQGGYAGFLRNTFDRFRFLIKGYEKVSKFVTKGKYTSFLTPVRNFFSQKVTQPVVRWLAKTAAGKAVKAGIKKAAGWLAVKLGIKMGIRAAAVAAAPESAGISLLIGLAIEAGTWLLGKIKNAVISLVKDPEKALMAVGAGILALVFIPMPFALIGALPIVMGGLGLMSFTLAPATLGTLGGGIGGFFMALAGLTFAAPIVLFVILLFAVLAGLTLFIVLVVSGAFILPSKISETTPTNISPYVSNYFEITKTPSDSKFDNGDVENGATIEYAITIRPKDNYVLSVSSLEENFTVFTENATGLTVDSSNCQFTATQVQQSIDKNEPLKCSINIDSRFKDSTISNTFTLKVGVIDGKTGEPISGLHIGMANAMVIIGDPPGDCPLIWPTYSGRITQGPESCFSHTGQEAIDVGSAPVGTTVLATHKGTVTDVACDPKGGGNFIKIEGNCNGIKFTSLYFHLKKVSVSPGQTVIPGNQIATSGNTTNCNGGTGDPHLHYEFRPFRSIMMISPYVPKTVPRRCGSGYAPCDPTRPLCNISW